MRYFCFDSALNEVYTLLLLQKEFPHHVNLFAGTKDESIWHVAPWLFQINDENIYEKWEDPNCHLERCIILETPVALHELKEHLQQFLYKKVTNKTVYNRFWDAKVLKSQLEKMSSAALSDFFEAIKDLFIQQDNSFIKITVDAKDRLKVEPISTSKLFSKTRLITPENSIPPIQEIDEKPKPKRRFFTD